MVEKPLVIGYAIRLIVDTHMRIFFEIFEVKRALPTAYFLVGWSQRVSPSSRMLFP